MCACNKDLCQNFLMEQANRHKWKVVIKRVRKAQVVLGKEYSVTMWGLYAAETIPAGAFVVEYVGEILLAKEGDRRGEEYDQIGMSYLFDMNEMDDYDECDLQ